MGKIINNRTLSAKNMLALFSPVILCVNRADYTEAIEEAQFQVMSLNLPLTKLLLGKSEKEISSTITGTIINILQKKPPIFLQDYEMLFDPRYQLDVLKVFNEISRHNRLIVKWCGGFDGDSLIYAEPGYADYSKYNASDYDVACVI
jgi:ATP sulfurylase